MEGAKRQPDPSLLKRLKIDAHAAWLAARDPRTPWYARAFGLLVTAYALSPIDLIPDFIPVLGLLDDARDAAAGVADRRGGSAADLAGGHGGDRLVALELEGQRS